MTFDPLVSQWLMALLIPGVLAVVVVWMDRKRAQLATWELICWTLIFIGLPFFVTVPLYLLFRSIKRDSRTKG